MKSWLHFVGRQYYTQAKFIKEAEKYGVSRRVSLQVLAKMEFGDSVYLAMKMRKHPHIFGKFTITNIYGISTEASAKLVEKTNMIQVSVGGEIVDRGCGSFVQGPTFQVSCNLHDIYEILKDCEDKGTLMIGGIFQDCEEVILWDMPFKQGYRQFNDNRFWETVKQYKSLKPNRKTPVVRGVFWPEDMEIEAQEKIYGNIIYIEDYKKKN